jgi:carbon storage regulator
MLVLSRRVDQSIIIGENIEIIIIESKDGNVRIGIEAPKDVKIYRKEILREIKDENKEALQININLIKSVIKK